MIHDQLVRSKVDKQCTKMEKPTASGPSDSGNYEPDSLSSTSEPTSDSGTKAHKKVAQSKETPHGELVVTPNPSVSIHQNQGVEEARQSWTDVEDKHTSHSLNLTPSYAFPIVETHPPPSSHALHSQAHSPDPFRSRASPPDSTYHVPQPPLPISSSNSSKIQGTTSVDTPDLSRSVSCPDSTQSVTQPPVSESNSELDRLKSENEKLKKRLLELDLQKEIGSINEEIKSLLKKVEELSDYKANAEKSAQESKDSKISELEKTIESMISEQSNSSVEYFKVLVHRIEELTREISERDKEISKLSDLKQENKELTNDRQKQADRRDRQVKYHKATEEELKKRKDELKTIESHLEVKKSEIKSLKEEKKRLTKELKSSKKDQDLFLRYLKLFD